NARWSTMGSDLLFNVAHNRTGQFGKWCRRVSSAHTTLHCFFIQFGGSEAIITAISDEYPIVKRIREIFVALLFSFYFIVGLASCTQVLFAQTKWVSSIDTFC